MFLLLPWLWKARLRAFFQAETYNLTGQKRGQHDLFEAPVGS